MIIGITPIKTNIRSVQKTNKVDFCVGQKEIFSENPQFGFYKSNPKNLWSSKKINFQGIGINHQINSLIKVEKDNVIKTNHYKTKIAQFLGTTIENLTPILTPNELKELLKTAKPENFSTGVNFENVLNGTFRINLHMHTTFSDGKMSPKAVLDQAAEYAKYRISLGKTEPVIVAISDHDTLEGVIEAIKIIANNPQRYKNIKFASAIEFNAQHDLKQIEAIGYGINPFCEKLKTFIEQGREINKQYLSSFLKQYVNKWEEQAGFSPEKQTTLEEVIKHAQEKKINCGSHLVYMGSGGLIAGFINTLKSIFSERKWHFEGLDKFAHQYGLKYKSLAINPSTSDVKEIIQIIKETGDGFVGIAHPCRNLGGVDLRYLFKYFKDIGAEAAEINYQYPTNSHSFPQSFQEHANFAASMAGFIKTGGMDNHTDNIFSSNTNLQKLPDDIKKIINQ